MRAASARRPSTDAATSGTSAAERTLRVPTLGGGAEVDGDDNDDDDDAAYAAAAERYMAAGRSRSSVLGARDALVPATLRSVWDIADESSSDEEDEGEDGGAEADGEGEEEEEDEAEDEDEDAHASKAHSTGSPQRHMPDVVVISVPEDPAPPPLRVDIAALRATAIGAHGGASPDVSSLTKGTPDRMESSGALLSNINVESPHAPETPAAEGRGICESTSSLQVPAEPPAGADAGKRRRSSVAGQDGAALGDAAGDAATAGTAAAAASTPPRPRRKSMMPGIRRFPRSLVCRPLARACTHSNAYTHPRPARTPCTRTQRSASFTPPPAAALSCHGACRFLPATLSATRRSCLRPKQTKEIWTRRYDLTSPWHACASF